MGVGLAEIFDEKPHDPIADEVKGEHCPTGFLHLSKIPQNNEEDNTFEKGFVKLGRVSEI